MRLLDALIRRKLPVGPDAPDADAPDAYYPYPFPQNSTSELKHVVVLKDAWARIEVHGRELRHMGAHGTAWTRTDCTHGLID